MRDSGQPWTWLNSARGQAPKGRAHTDGPDGTPPRDRGQDVLQRTAMLDIRTI